MQVQRKAVLSAAGMLLVGIAAAQISADAAPSKSDAALLQKAVSTLERSPALEIKSEVTITGAGEGIRRNLRERIQFARISGHRFRASASTTATGNRVTAVYATVCNGAKVWTVAPGEGEYAEISQADFCQPSNVGSRVAALGLIGALLVSRDQSGADGLQDFATVIAQTGRSAGAIIVNGKRVRELTSVIGGNRVSLDVDPTTDMLVRLVFTGNTPRLNFNVVETLQGPPLKPKLPDKAFQFTPPHGLRQVLSIPIGFLP
jgi:hypothetical protein